MNLQDAFGLVAFFYSIANLLSMGMELDIKEAVRLLKTPKLPLLALFFSWIAGPALAYVIIQILPLKDGYVAGLFIFSLAPTAPSLPMFIRIAKADMSFAAALIPLSVISTVIMMPLLANVFIPGLQVSTFEIAKPLFLTVLLPLVAGAALQAYAGTFAKKALPWVKKIAGISTLLLLVFTLGFYWKEFIAALGTWAIGAQVFFVVIIAALTYYLSFGYNHIQRGAMSLGICTRNGGAMFVAITAFPVIDPHLLVFILLSVPVPIIVWYFFSKLLAKRAAAIS